MAAPPPPPLTLVLPLALDGALLEYGAAMSDALRLFSDGCTGTCGLGQ